MGRWCYFRNGVDYKFWFGIQNSGFDFLDGIVGVNEKQLYCFDEDDCEGTEFLEWWENESAKTGLGNSFTLSELNECSTAESFKEEWKEYLLEAENVQFEMGVDSDALLLFIKAIGSVFQIPKFQEYEMTSEGTDKLWNDICVHFENTKYDKTIPEIRKADFCLACLIYHMSLYNDSICGIYEY